MSTPEHGAQHAPHGGHSPDEPPYGQPAWPPGGEVYDHRQATQQYSQQPYGQHAYGQPGYGQPSYPPGFGPGFQPYGRPTNSLAIVALVLALTFAPAGLVTGIIARRQIKQTHEDGDGLALAAVIVGGIVTAIFVLVIVVMLIAMIAVANDPASY